MPEHYRQRPSVFGHFGGGFDRASPMDQLRAAHQGAVQGGQRNAELNRRFMFGPRQGRGGRQPVFNPLQARQQSSMADRLAQAMAALQRAPMFGPSQGPLRRDDIIRPDPLNPISGTAVSSPHPTAAGSIGFRGPLPFDTTTGRNIPFHTTDQRNRFSQQHFDQFGRRPAFTMRNPGVGGGMPPSMFMGDSPIFHLR